MRTFRGAVVALGLLAAILGLVAGSAVLAAAQTPPPRPNLIVDVSGDPKLAASNGPVIYAIKVKNDGSTRALNVIVTVVMPTAETPGTAASRSSSTRTS